MRSTGPIAVGNSRRTSASSSPITSTCSARRRWRSASTPSFTRPGSTPSSWAESCRTSWICTSRASPVLRGVTRHSSIDPVGSGLGIRRLHSQGARRTHPVEGLVRPAVGVDEQAAVALVNEQARRERQMRGEPTRVVDGAAGYDEAHPTSLTGRTDAAAQCGPGDPRRRSSPRRALRLRRRSRTAQSARRGSRAWGGARSDG